MSSVMSILVKYRFATAELIALDLGPGGDWAGWTVTIRNAIGEKFYSIVVKAFPKFESYAASGNSAFRASKTSKPNPTVSRNRCTSARIRTAGGLNSYPDAGSSVNRS